MNRTQKWIYKKRLDENKEKTQEAAINLNICFRELLELHPDPELIQDRHEIILDILDYLKTMAIEHKNKFLESISGNIKK